MVVRDCNDAILEKILSIIIDVASPEKVILFGSRARGDFSATSDYDILIIKSGMVNERFVTRKINYELFNQQVKVSVDLIATTPEKWQENLNKIGYIYSQVNSEGVVLYG